MKLSEISFERKKVIISFADGPEADLDLTYWKITNDRVIFSYWFLGKPNFVHLSRDLVASEYEIRRKSGLSVVNNGVRFTFFRGGET